MYEVWSYWSVLLLWGCMWFDHSPAHGALVISRTDDPLTQETNRFVGARSIKKRSITNPKVEVYSVTLDCIVASRFARTVMSSSALNKANSSQEIFFEVELPKTAFITNFSMEIDGQVYAGEVKEKEKAKKQYQKAVSSGKTAGLVKASGRKMEKFSVSVNIAANSEVTFVLIYEELLQRKLGQYEILTRVTQKQLVHKLQVVANIYEPQGIAYVDAYGTFLSNNMLPAVEKTVSDTKAHISFSPTLEQQRKCPDCDGTLIDGDFIIKYDVKRPTSLGDVQIVNGYFVHFFAPPDLPRVPKNVVFVIDRSGSMSGTKMRQTQDAMVAILKDLHGDDHLGLIQFDDTVLTWKDSLTQATKQNVAEAMKYAQKINANGGTDINDAVLTAVKMLVKDRQDQKLPERSVDMIILLTDGLPNMGESSLPKIHENVRAAINGEMSLFCLGFGNNVDYSFLDVMAKQNKGLARRIYEASDASIQLQGFYEEVASTLLSEVDLRYPDNTVALLTNNHFTQLFNGSEIVVAGRLSDNDVDNFMVEVFAKGSKIDFQVEGQATAVDWNDIYPEKEYIFEDFTERMWAYITIQQLLEQSEIGTELEKSNATAKALEMSLKYGFVTPLTSLVVTKPDSEDGPGSPLIAEKLTEDQRQKAERTAAIDTSYNRIQSSHSSAGRQAADGDPHFMIELPDQEDALCFDINDTPGTIFNLVKDSTSGFLVNGELIEQEHYYKKKAKTHTYFGRFGIIHQSLGVRLEVTTEDISVSQDGERVTLLWSDTAALHGPNMNLNLTENCALTVTLKDSVKFKVVLHSKVWEKLHHQQHYLGFYTLDGHLLSPAVHGLLGQFYHGLEFEVGDLRPGKVPEKPDATMYVKGQELHVTRHYQRDFHRDVKNGVIPPCWFIHNNGTGLIDGDASAYIVSGLFNTI